MATGTLTRMMKKALFSSVIPLANRRTPHRNYTSYPLKASTTIATNLYTQISRATIIPTHQISAQAKKQSDDPFRVVESEIDFSVDEFLEAAQLPREFSVKIKDYEPTETIITLTREYQGENIEVTASKPGFGGDCPDDDLTMKITVRKKSGRNLTFHVERDEDGTRIDLLTLYNPHPSDDYIEYQDPDDFSAFNEELQEAFCTYLEDRGITPSTAKFLCEYLNQRKHRKYTGKS